MRLPLSRPSATPPSISRRGFTVLEVVVAITIIVLLAGAVIVANRDPGSQKELRETISEIELLTARARAAAINKQETYWAVFSHDKLLMIQGAPTATPTQLLKLDPVATLPYPEGVSVEILGWNSNGWIKPSARTPFALRFEPLGFIEPVSIRVSSHNGFIEQSYNPLSGAVEEESFEIR